MNVYNLLQYLVLGGDVAQIVSRHSWIARPLIKFSSLSLSLTLAYILSFSLSLSFSLPPFLSLLCRVYLSVRGREKTFVSGFLSSLSLSLSLSIRSAVPFPLLLLSSPRLSSLSSKGLFFFGYKSPRSQAFGVCAFFRFLLFVFNSSRFDPPCLTRARHF